MQQGGGKSLLVALLAVAPDNVKRLAQLDSRITLPESLPGALNIKFVAQLGIKLCQDLPSYAMMFGGVLAIRLVQSGKIEAGFAKIRLYRHTS